MRFKRHREVLTFLLVYSPGPCADPRHERRRVYCRDGGANPSGPLLLQPTKLSYAHVPLCCTLFCCPECGPRRAESILEEMAEHTYGLTVLHVSQAPSPRVEASTRQAILRAHGQYLWIRDSLTDPCTYLASVKHPHSTTISRSQALRLLYGRLRAGIHKRGTSRGWHLTDAEMFQHFRKSSDAIFMGMATRWTVRELMPSLRLVYNLDAEANNWPRWAEWPLCEVPGELPPLAPWYHKSLLTRALQVARGEPLTSIQPYRPRAQALDLIEDHRDEERALTALLS